MTHSIRTRVAIVGAGPAGLILSHLLAEQGIESMIIDQRSRVEIESTIRAGVLEQGTVDLLTRIDPATRVDTVGHRHDGIELRFQGEGHRIDFPSLVGRSVWVYPQHEVLKDLLALRLATGQDIRFGVSASRVEGADTDRPRVIAMDSGGQEIVIDADFVVGADGSRSVVRSAVTGAAKSGYFREYPFAWFGILCEAPRAATNSSTAIPMTASPSSASAVPRYSACTSSVPPTPMPRPRAKLRSGTRCRRASRVRH